MNEFQVAAPLTESTAIITQKNTVTLLQNSHKNTSNVYVIEFYCGFFFSSQWKKNTKRYRSL